VKVSDAIATLQTPHAFIVVGAHAATVFHCRPKVYHLLGGSSNILTPIIINKP